MMQKIMFQRQGWLVMEPILDLVKSYLTDASKGEAEISPKLVEEFKEACGEALKR